MTNTKKKSNDKKKENKLKKEDYIKMCKDISIECIEKAFKLLKRERRKHYGEKHVYDVNDILNKPIIYVEFIEEIVEILQTTKNYDKDFYSNVMFHKKLKQFDMKRFLNHCDNYIDEIKNDKAFVKYKENIIKNHKLKISLYDKLIRKIKSYNKITKN